MVLAKCLSPLPAFGRNHKTTHPIVMLFNKHNTYHFQILPHTEISKFPICIRPVPHSEDFVCAKLPGKSEFSDDNSNSDEDHGQQEGKNVDCDPTFEASFSSSESHLLTQGYLNDLVRDLNLIVKQAELLFLD
jgi:hypothetical protein